MSEGRWEQALSENPDFILIQFGHNDSHAPDKPEATDAKADYRQYLRRYIREARAIDATPILITPMVRRAFDATNRIVESMSPRGRPLETYARAMKDVAGQENVSVIDLYASSRALAEKIGAQASADLASTAGDITHFNEDGARSMVKLVIAELFDAEPRLAQFLVQL